MEIKLLRLVGDLLRITVVGRISRDGWVAKRDPIGELFGDDVYKRNVLLSLGLSETMDSTGVEWLLAAHRKFQAAGGKLVVHSAKPVMLQILRMMRIDLVLNIATDEEAAEALCAGVAHG